VPLSTSALTAAQSTCLADGSRLDVGSSRKTTGGATIRLAARSSRRRIPPEYVFTARPAASSRPNSLSNCCARVAASRWLRRCSLPNIARLSRPVSLSSTDASCPESPIWACTFLGSVSASYPPTHAAPLSGFNNVARIRTMVVLPAPFGPRSARTCPRATSRSTLSRARAGPYDLQRAVTEIIGRLDCVVDIGCLAAPSDRTVCSISVCCTTSLAVPCTP
jgi:hypothetical protein